MTDLQDITRLAKRKPILRWLVCPHCGSDKGGKPAVKFYACSCGWEYDALAELAVRPDKVKA